MTNWKTDTEIWHDIIKADMELRGTYGVSCFGSDDTEDDEDYSDEEWID